MDQSQFETVFSSHGINFAIKVMSDEDLPAVEEYCETCADEGVENNSSLSALKIGRYEAERWWLVYDLEAEKVISLAGCYHFKEYQENSYRGMYRLATLKEYRGKAGPFGKDQKSCFGWGRILPLQVNFARSQGAAELLFTTNSGDEGDLNSLRQNRVCELVFERLGMAQKIGEIELYTKKQNLWKVLIEDVYSKKRLQL